MRLYLYVYLVTYWAGARVGDGAGVGAASSRRLTEVAEEAGPSSAGDHTPAGRGTEGSGPLEGRHRETAAEEQAVQATSRGSRTYFILVYPAYVNDFCGHLLSL